MFRSLVCLTVLSCVMWFADSQGAAAQAMQPQPRRGVIIEFHEDINPLSGELLKRRFGEAVDADYNVIILDIHSPGGYTSVTFELMDMLLQAQDVETVAWIEKDAISGAALLSLAADKMVKCAGCSHR